jgi:hypothetical protein
LPQIAAIDSEQAGCKPIFRDLTSAHGLDAANVDVLHSDDIA